VSEPKSLTDAFGDYPLDHPQTLRALLDADPDSITHPIAWFLRGQAVDVMRSTDQHYINGPKDAFKLLKNGYVLHPWTGRWTTYALGETRQVLMVAHPRGGTTPLRKSTAMLPRVDDLPQLPPGTRGSAKRPSWLVIFGGEPSVLSKPGVARGLATLHRRVPVADVLFFHRDPAAGITPTLWSAAAGVGLSDTGAPGGRDVAFPDAEALEILKGVSHEH
jgi:hypothetical protein